MASATNSVQLDRTNDPDQDSIIEELENFTDSDAIIASVGG